MLGGAANRLPYAVTGPTCRITAVSMGDCGPAARKSEHWRAVLPQIGQRRRIGHLAHRRPPDWSVLSASIASGVSAPARPGLSQYVQQATRQALPKCPQGGKSRGMSASLRAVHGHREAAWHLHHLPLFPVPFHRRYQRYSRQAACVMCVCRQRPSLWRALHTDHQRWHVPENGQTGPSHHCPLAASGFAYHQSSVACAQRGEVHDIVCQASWPDWALSSLLQRGRQGLTMCQTDEFQERVRQRQAVEHG